MKVSNMIRRILQHVTHHSSYLFFKKLLTLLNFSSTGVKAVHPAGL
jgi:hypothetical protein